MGNNFFANWTPAKVEAHNARVAAAQSKPDIINVARNNARYAVDPFPAPDCRFHPGDYDQTEQTWTIKVSPMGAVRCNRSVRWKKTPRQVAYFAYKDQLRAAVGPLASCPDECHIIAWMPMPASWSEKKKKRMNGQPHRARIDSDNITKACLDAILSEDKGVWSTSCRKYWTNAGLERLDLRLVWWMKKK